MKVLKLHNKLPRHKRPWINITKHDGDRLKPTSKLYVNPTVPKCSLLPPSCMRPMRNTNSYILHKRDSYNSRHKPYEKYIQRELQAAQSAQEYENVIQELRRQAAEQPDIQKLLWKRQLSQQSTYRAEIHELQTEMLNMKEKSEMQSRLAANVCEQSVPSRSVDSEPDNVLNTLSPGRSTRWILPEELETPNRPTSSGLQSPVGVPVQLGPSQEYVRPAPCGIPPAQWGDLHAREGMMDVSFSEICL